MRKIRIPNRLRMLMMVLVPGCCTSAAAQDTTAYRLEGVEVIATRIDQSTVGKHTDRLDSSVWKGMFAPSLANVLSLQTPLYVRSYGSGSLATLGIRGGSSSQTQVMWNGVPLRNPMIGLTDLALIPAALLDRAAVHYGGHGAAFGSGAMGGLIDIGSSPSRQVDLIEVNGSGGSWGSWLGGLRLDYGSRRLRLSTRYAYQQADNDYTYKLNRDLPPKTQTHHALTHHALLQEILLDMEKAGQLRANVWYQYADRQIPPTSVQNVSQAAQQDENIRAVLEWKRTGSLASWEARTAYLDETIDYQDTLILVYNSNRFQTWLGEVSTSRRLGERVQLAGGLYAEQVTAVSDGYAGQQRRHQQAAYISLRARTGEWVWRLQSREERTDGQWSPWLWDIGTEWDGIPHLRAKASVSRNYRVPTLNDLYWRPGGNPELVPELGMGGEAGVAYERVAGAHSVQASLTGYVRSVEQWIMWLPPVKDVRNYWSPVNITRVKSRGLETRMAWTVAGRSVELTADAGMDLTWSNFAEDVPDLGVEAGDQMLYVPVENLLGGLRMSWKGLSAGYRHYWYGDSPGINEQVNAANVGTANLGYAFGREPMVVSLYLQVDNVWNVPYRFIERRPMPGRGFQVGLRIGWTGRKKAPAIG